MTLMKTAAGIGPPARCGQHQRAIDLCDELGHQAGEGEAVSSSPLSCASMLEMACFKNPETNSGKGMLV
jgi:hypothetical protein